MRDQMALDLRDRIHSDVDDDQQAGAAEIEAMPSRRWAPVPLASVTTDGGTQPAGRCGNQRSVAMGMGLRHKRAASDGDVLRGPRSRGAALLRPADLAAEPHHVEPKRPLVALSGRGCRREAADWSARPERGARPLGECGCSRGRPRRRWRPPARGPRSHRRPRTRSRSRR